MSAQFAARRNRSIMFDRDLCGIEIELTHEFGDGGSGSSAGFAIYGQGNHAARLSPRSDPCKRRNEHDAD